MINLLFLNIGHDLSNFFEQLDTTINEARKSSAALKILLWPLHYVVASMKLLTAYSAKGATQAYNYTVPETIINMRNHLISATPNSIYCFNKTGFLIFFADMYFMCYYFIKIILRVDLAYTYILCKLTTIIMPFLLLSPLERLPFWLLALGLTVVEICLGLWMIICWGYGINWENDHFYNHWKKCYRYRYASGNRQLTVELSAYIYVISKVLILVDYFCYNEKLLKARLAAPHTPTKGAADFDMNSLSPLLEQDSGLLIGGAVLLLSAAVLLLSYISPGRHGTQQGVTSPVTWNSSTATQCTSAGNVRVIVGTAVGLLAVVGAGFLGVEMTNENTQIAFACGVTATCVVFGVIDYYCKRQPEQAPKAPEIPKASEVPEASTTTKGALDLDLDYVTSLLEQDSVANLRYGILFLLALSSLGVYSIILAGWSSNSKYAFIGALRSAAQMISYEVAISLIILPIVLFAGSLNLTMITYVQSITIWFLWPLLPVSILFLIAMLAETNRTPFDLPEAEAELVAGYNVDYSSLPFAMFFLGEYCNMILISTLYCILFLGGGLNSLGLPSALLLSFKAAITWIFFVLVRATLPRYRYDQLMDIGWKVFLPVAGAFLLFVFGVLVYCDALPVANELPLAGNIAIPLFMFFSARPSKSLPARSSFILQQNGYGPLTELLLLLWWAKGLTALCRTLTSPRHYKRPLWSQYSETIAQKAAAEYRLSTAQTTLEASIVALERAWVATQAPAFYCAVLVIYVAGFALAIWCNRATREGPGVLVAASLHFPPWLLAVFGGH